MAFMLTVWLANGCTKNETKYYADQEDLGLGIFSNTGNNLLSCFIGGKAWRTYDRVISGLNPLYRYEINMYRLPSGTLRDTLVINWQGGFADSAQLQAGSLNLFLFVPHDAMYQYLSGLQGKRLQINAGTGYFTTGINGLNSSNTKGTGNIYFQTARFDSVNAYTYRGNVSGLFDADFGSFTITKGRFDHIMTEPQIRF